MKTKQQIQDEMAELQKLLEEMERQRWYLTTPYGDTLTLSGQTIDNLFMVEEYQSASINHQPHGLGKFETREEAERTRVVLIGALDLAKRDTLYVVEKMAWDCLLARGKDVIKAIEEGTYE